MNTEAQQPYARHPDGSPLTRKQVEAEGRILCDCGIAVVDDEWISECPDCNDMDPCCLYCWQAGCDAHKRTQTTGDGPKCAKCGGDIVTACEHINAFEIDQDDQERLGIDWASSEAIVQMSDGVSVGVHFCRKCHAFEDVWIEDYPGMERGKSTAELETEHTLRQLDEILRVLNVPVDDAIGEIRRLQHPEKPAPDIRPVSELIEALRPFAEAYAPGHQETDDAAFRYFLDCNEATPLMNIGAFRRAWEAVTAFDAAVAAKGEG